MCYNMMCSYQDRNGDCTINSVNKPNDAICILYDEEDFIPKEQKYIDYDDYPLYPVRPS